MEHLHLSHNYVFLYYVMLANLSYLFYVLVVPVHVILVLSSFAFCMPVYICLVATLCPFPVSQCLFEIKVLLTRQHNNHMCMCMCMRTSTK